MGDSHHFWVKRWCHWRRRVWGGQSLAVQGLMWAVASGLLLCMLNTVVRQIAYDAARTAARRE